ncbi:DUF6171 family protein [Leptospira mayottensis]|uniref:Uncharacterized protein n=1 Tax=Leptospira mayottensis 200901122 TaxID=1193010 RepID=A0AA87SVK6_9LEPT|nr:DUF6171 family protein [Leptospira mayottensis]EKR98081.1 hypothetical protein LEP1GSC125_1563 [Leptospira mayottensis 200901122]
MNEKKDLDLRLEICFACPLLLKGFLLERCSVCGCFVRLKTKLKYESCPIKKWM